MQPATVHQEIFQPPINHPEIVTAVFTFMVMLRLNKQDELFKRVCLEGMHVNLLLTSSSFSN